MNVALSFRLAWFANRSGTERNLALRGRLAWYDVAERVESRVGYFTIYDPGHPQLAELVAMSQRIRSLLSRRYQLADRRRAAV